MGTASWQFKNKAPNSASAVDAMVLRSILHTMYTIPLSVGSNFSGSYGDGGFLLKKCMPPALLRGFGKDKWEVLLWTHRTISLCVYHMVAYGFVER